MAQKICRTAFEVLYFVFSFYNLKFNRNLQKMLFGMSDPWVAAAYLGNIAVTLICVVYGVICYNSGDDSEEKQ